MILYKVILDAYYLHKKHFVAFLLTGVVTAMLYFSLFTFGEKILHASQTLSVCLAYSLAAFFHFFVNKKKVFRSKKSKNLRTFSKYIVLLIVNYGITLLVLHIGLLFMLSMYLSLVVAAGITAVSGYIMNRFWVFKVTI